MTDDAIGTAGHSPARQAVIRFRIAGPMRFLSHAETARVFQRVCARAGFPIRYSEGFNPHPRLSLPLPRPVGVESDEELLVVKLCEDGSGESVENQAEREAALKQALAAQLPEGIEVSSVDLVAAHAAFQPQSAEYVLPLRTQEETGLVERVKDRIATVMASAHCLVDRAAGEGRATRPVDVRPFLQSIRWEDANLIVPHRTGAGGSIRVEEILQIFGLRTQDLAGPIRRTKVLWETTEQQNPSKEPCMETRAEETENGT